jgi:peroxiredoxin
MKRYYLIPIFILILFSSCNNTVQIMESNGTHYYYGLGLIYDIAWENPYFEHIFADSPFRELKKSDIPVRGDIVHAWKKNNKDIIVFSEKTYRQFMKDMRTAQGDTITFQLIRKQGQKVIKTWTVTVTARRVNLKGYDLRLIHFFKEVQNNNRRWPTLYTEKEFNRYSKIMANKYYHIYLKEGENEIGRRAMRYALTNWSKTDAYTEVRKAIKHIPYDSQLWCEISYSINSTYDRTKDKKIIAEGTMLLESLVTRVSRDECKSSLYDTLGGIYEQKNDLVTAFLHYKKAYNLSTIAQKKRLLSSSMRSVRYIQIGKMAPDFSMKDIDGNSINLSSYRGKVVLLHFWSSFCGFSRGEYRFLKKVFDEHGRKSKFIMVGVNTDGNIATTRKTIEKFHMNWHHIQENFRGNDRLLHLYGRTGIPFMVLIDAKGVIVEKDLRGEKLVNVVKKYLNK